MKISGLGRGRGVPPNRGGSNQNDGVNRPGYSGPASAQVSGPGPSSTSASSNQQQRPKSDEPDANVDEGIAVGSTQEMAGAPSEPVYAAAKVEPGRIGVPVKLGTTLYEIHVDDDCVAYRYDVNFFTRSGKKGKEEMRMRGSNDNFGTKRRELSYLLFAYLVEKREKTFFANFFCFTYDRHHIMYTITALDIPSHETKSFAVKVEDFAMYISNEFPIKKTADDIRVEYDFTRGLTSFIMEIKQCEDAFSVHPADKSPLLEPNLLDRDQSNVQYLEQVLSQNVYYNMNHLVFGNRMYEKYGHKTLKSNQERGAVAEIASGLVKSVRLIEGEPGSEPKYVQALDYKVCAFLMSQPVMLFMASKYGIRAEDDYFSNQKAMIHHENASRYLKDFAIQFRAKKANNEVVSQKKFVCSGLSARSASVQTFPVQGPDGMYETSVNDYFREQYGIKLRYPQLPCLVQYKQGNNRSYFPMEFCDILPDQRLDMERARDYTAEMIKHAALLPPRRKALVEKLARDAGLFDNNHFNAIGLKVNPKAMEVDGRILPQPNIVFATDKGGVRVQKPNEHGGWRHVFGNRFIRGARLDSYYVCVLANAFNRDGSLQPPIRLNNELRTFVQELTNKAGEMGMKAVKPCTASQVFVQADDVEGVSVMMNRAMRDNVKFVYFFTHEQSSSHDHIKLWEQQTQVLTQHILTSTVNKCLGLDRGRPDANCLENIIRKTNMKLGGINFGMNYDQLNLADKQTWQQHNRLVVGYDVSHPPPLSGTDKRRGRIQTQPSVAGMCANSGNDELQFVGRYWYMQPKREIDAQCPFIRRNMVDFLRQYQVNNKKDPKEIWFYRDGVSEGQYAKSIKYEVKDIRAAISDVLGNRADECKLVYIVVTKRHPVKLYLKDFPSASNSKAFELNVKSATVVDLKLPHPGFKEFYLNSHKAIQGTAHTPRYTVLVDDAGHGLDELEVYTHSMCMAHGIVYSAVSIPAPVYAAHNLAKRGKNILDAYVRTVDTSSGISDDSALSTASFHGLYDNVDIDKLNKELAIDNDSPLARIAFYA